MTTLVPINPNQYPNSGTLPQVGDTLLDYFQVIQFSVVQKSVVDFQVQENVTTISFMGVWQPFGAQKLKMKPEGQRKWKWFQLHSDPSLSLFPDDIVTFNSVQYRVMDRLDYALYGYMEYHLISDFKGTGP